MAALDLHPLSFPLPFSSVSLFPCRANCCFKCILWLYQAVGCKYFLFCFKTHFVHTKIHFLIKCIAQDCTKQLFVSCAEASFFYNYSTIAQVSGQPLYGIQLAGIIWQCWCDCIEPRDSDTIHLSRFSFNYRSPMGTSGVVKQRNQHYSNYWLTMKWIQSCHL